MDYPFTLPRGLRDASGHLHRHGLMRPALALDEIEPLRDPRVRDNEAWYGPVLLSRVVSLGDLGPLTPEQVAHLPAADFAYLQGLYMTVNVADAPTPNTRWALPPVIETRCVACGADLALDLPPELLEVATP